MDKYFFWGFLLGIALCVTGWLTSHPSEYSFVRETLTPEYRQTLNEYEGLKKRVGERQNVQENNLRSFVQLFKYASDDPRFQSPQTKIVSQFKDWDISLIRLAGYVPYALTPDGNMREQANFQIWDGNGNTALFTVYDLGSFIKDVYGTHFLFHYSGWIFWAGIGLLCFLILGDRISCYV